MFLFLSFFVGYLFLSSLGDVVLAPSEDLEFASYGI